MTIAHLSTSAPTAAVPEQRSLARSAGVLLLLEVAIFLVCLFTLSASINWPAVLDEPAAVVLPLILEQRVAVLVGYGAYLLSSLLIIPMALLLRRALDPARSSALLAVATTFGVLAGLAKPLGILRWLVAMPVLARAYVDPAASATTRETITLLYTTLNAYAGSLGEVLGVLLLSGLWALLLGLALLRTRWLPSWAGWTGVAAGALSLLGLVELADVNLGPLLTIGNAAWQLWVLAVGVLLLRAR